jgi:DNA-binding beta-propeller fold protein YncE
MAVAGDTLYVADLNHSRVVTFDLATGKPIGYWPVDRQPGAVALDGGGNAYVLSDDGLLTKYRLD